MTAHFKHFGSGRALRFSISGIIIVLLWLAGTQFILARPASTQDFVLTTVDDFTPGNFTRTGLGNYNGGEVQLLKVGVAGKWVTDTQQLPAPRAQLGVVSVGNRIYAFGGNDTSGPLPQVYSSTATSNGLTAWVTQTNGLPIGLTAHIGLVATVNNVARLYALGGLDTTFNYSSKIYYAALNSDGSVGSWTTNSINLPTAIEFASGIVNKGRIYVIGGIRTGGTYRSEVYDAPINSNGSVGAWLPTSSLPVGLALSAAVVYNGPITDTIYVMGGALDGLNNTANVYFADVNADGSLTAWTTSSGNLPAAFSSHAAVQANGEIYVIGGNEGGLSSSLLPRKTVLAALIDQTDPSRLVPGLAGINQSWVTTAPLFTPRHWHGAAMVDGEIFTVGGDDTDAPSGFNPTRISYHGSTRGFGASYAPSGFYVSPAINVGSPTYLTEFSWSSVMTDHNVLTMNTRYHTSTNGINWNAWSPLLPSNPQPSANINDAKPITYSLNTTAQYFQTQTFFTTANNALTPFLTEIHLKANSASSDLAVSKAGSANVVLPGNPITYTIVYTNLVGNTVPNAVLTETVPANTTYVESGVGWARVGSSSMYVKSLGPLAAGVSGATIFVVRVNTPFPPGVPAVNNTVVIGGDPNEVNLTNNTGSARTFVHQPVPGVDLSVSKDDGYSSVSAGQTLTYMVQYANFGDTAAGNTVLTETLPAGMTYAGGPAWTPVSSNSFIHALGTVFAGDTGSITFVAQVSPGIGGGTALTNTVRIGFPGVDVNPSNNVATDVDYVGLSSPQIYKYSDAAVVAPGQTITYNLTVLNAGGSVANNLVITETPPLSLVTVVTSGWTQIPSTNMFVKSFGTLAPGASISDTFIVRVLNSAPGGSVFTNTARVNADNRDPAQTTGLVSTQVNIVGTVAPDLQVSASAPTNVGIGTATGVVVTVTNAGQGAAGNWFSVEIYLDRIPQSRTDLGDAHIELGGLSSGAQQTIVFNLVWSTPGKHTMYVQVDTCDLVDPGWCSAPSYGRIAESNESNNIFGPLNIVVLPYTVFLPLVHR